MFPLYVFSPWILLTITMLTRNKNIKLCFLHWYHHCVSSSCIHSVQSHFDLFNKLTAFSVTSPRKIYHLLFLTLGSICLISSSCFLAICPAPQNCSLQLLTGSSGNTACCQFSLKEQHSSKDGGAGLCGLIYNKLWFRFPWHIFLRDIQRNGSCSLICLPKTWQKTH